jgi:hypothetical protein
MLADDVNKKEGLKLDVGKQGWYPMPLIVLKPLADVYIAGEKKYAIFNCLNPFKDSDRRFWDASMRHLEACQIDPLAIDEETGCYHGAQVAFNMLMRIFNAVNKKKDKKESKSYNDIIKNNEEELLNVFTNKV